MPFYKTINGPEQSRQNTSVFYGLADELEVMDGAFEDMKNLTSSEYPLLAARPLRGKIGSVTTPQGMLAKVALAEVLGNTLYYNGLATSITNLSVPNITRSATIPVSPSAGDYWYDTAHRWCLRYTGSEWLECEYPQKQLVSMGAYICVFPDGAYYNTLDASDYGYMGATYQSVEDSTVTFSICKEDGSAYDSIITSDTAPASPSNGDAWIDTSEPTYALHVWSSAQDQWVTIATTFVKITFTSQNNMGNFSQWDGVEISGIDGNDEMEALNGSHILYDVHSVSGQSDYIIITGMMSTVSYMNNGQVTVARRVPQMDYVCECGNRLWGCRYGFDSASGQNLNELYCCALGDFKNWEQYRGISTDSWRASVGTDGPWTGCINYLGYPTFFKEERLHRINISSTGAHQVSDIPCRGVAKGSWRSLVMVDEVLYFNSRDCVCAYDGSVPTSVSQRQATRYSNVKWEIRRKMQYATAGSIGKKYYISGYCPDYDDWFLMVYDTKYGVWHIEDNTSVLGFARLGSELYFVNDKLEKWCCFGSEGTHEDTVEWMAQTGLMGYEYPDQKYVSRFDFRVLLPRGATFNLEVSYDSSGYWENPLGRYIVGTSDAPRSFVIPVRPRRCDHLRFRLSGTGLVKVYSIARILEVGSDVVYPVGGV